MHYVKCKLHRAVNCIYILDGGKTWRGAQRCVSHEKFRRSVRREYNKLSSFSVSLLFCRDTEEWIQQQESVHGEQSNKGGAAEQHGQVRPFTAQYIFLPLSCGEVFSSSGGWIELVVIRAEGNSCSENRRMIEASYSRQCRARPTSASPPLLSSCYSRDPHESSIHVDSRHNESMFERGLSYLKKACVSVTLARRKSPVLQVLTRTIRHRSVEERAVETCETAAAAAAKFTSCLRSR